ncbi:MAG: murein biosynthesis integral membrane protein MurJ [Polyangiaceae bacterium]|nr:murein biosynthesis integral membrane protein MurJ [Polyangiaceae bacterium]
MAAGADEESTSESAEVANQIAENATEPPAPEPPSPAPKPAGGRGAALVTAGIILARLAGIVRQRVQAHYFGTGPLADVLTAAFRLGNITQNLLGEGTLSATFIPVYAKLRAEGKAAEARRFALAALGLLAAVSGLASIVGAVFAPWLSFIIAAGFDGERRDLTVSMARVLFPMTGLLVLSAWALGVLNAHRRFFLPYAAPVVWSLAQIAGMVAFGTFLHTTGADLAHVLAYSALLGAGLQLFILLPATRRLVGGLTPTLNTKDPNVRQASARLPGAIAGRGIIQISGLIDTQLVSFLAPGDTAAFGYAQTIYLLPMALLGTGEAAAALPELARDTAEQDAEKRNIAMADRIGKSIARVATLSIPAGLSLTLMGRELVAVIVQTGKFDQSATERVAILLAAYGFSLFANAVGRILITASYALGDTKTPVRYAIYRVVVSTVIALLLMKPLGVLGVVIGAVVAGWVETITLGIRLHKQIGGLGLSNVRWVSPLAAGLLACGAGILVRLIFPEQWAGMRIVTFPLGPSLSLVAFGAVFLALATAFGMLNVRALLRRRR